MNSGRGREEFWRPHRPRGRDQDTYAAFMRLDADQRAAEADALMDRAEAPDCLPHDRHALLLDTSTLLRHAITETPALALAYQRLRRLLEGREE